MNRKPRLAIAVQRFPAPSETFIVTKVLGLLDRGFDVQIFTAAPGDRWDRFGILAGREDVRRRIHVAPPTDSMRRVVTAGLPCLLRALIRHPRALLRFARHCWAHRRRHPLGFLKALYTRLHYVGQQVDILHIEFDTQALGLTDLKHYLSCKVLLSARGTFQKTTVLDRYPDAPAQLFRDADGYHFISHYLRENTRRLGLPAHVRTWVIEPAIDLRLFSRQPSTVPSRTPGLRIISVGRLVWDKGYEFALDAIGLVVRAGIQVKYTILGEGPYEEPVIFTARQWGLLGTGVVHLAGTVAHKDVASYLSNADVMIHAALTEGFCNAVIEGQAAGLPVVCTDAGGLPENVEDGVTGFVVPRRNPEAMAERIIQLARDPALRRRMGAAGRERALARYDLNHQIAAFVSLYEELASDAVAH